MSNVSDLNYKLLLKKQNNQPDLSLQNINIHSCVYDENCLNNNHLEIAVPVVDKSSPIVIKKKQPLGPTSVKVDLTIIQPQIKSNASNTLMADPEYLPQPPIDETNASKTLMAKPEYPPQPP